VRYFNPPVHDVTQLLVAWSEGDKAALDRLTPLVYKELHRLARAFMAGERAGHTLQATALVHEAYLKLINLRRAQWRDRAQFFALASKLMRHILVDFARVRRSQKRGGPLEHLRLEEPVAAAHQRNPDLISLDDALEKLAAIDPRKCQIVELRFFGGLSVDETARTLNVAVSTVHRDFDLARMWLLRELEREDPWLQGK
jgi:RNA polymerase sigma factor (TIGR02999 family)